MKKKMLMLCFAGISATAGHAQSIGPATINATGSSATIAGNTYEFSIGELITTTATGPGIVITQGVLQPADDPTGIDDKDFFAGSLKLFPNPAEDLIFLQPSFTTGGKLSFQLYDMLGRVMRQEDVMLSTGHEKQTLDLKLLASATYTLDVRFEQKGKTFHTAYKIQKVK